MPPKISIDELAHLTATILDSLKKEGVTNIAVDADYYWSIPKDELYAPYKEPTEFTLGQLSWDLEALQKIAGGERDVLLYHLVWLGELLKSAGHGDIAR